MAGWVGRDGVGGVEDGDGEAFGVEKCGKVQHGVHVALEWSWEEEKATARIRSWLGH